MRFELTSPYDFLIEEIVEAQFESITQDRTLKACDVYRYADGAGIQWWRKAVGCTHTEYFLNHQLGAVLTYLRIELSPHQLMPQERITVLLRGLLGGFPNGQDRVRFGGIDEILLVNAAGATLAHLESYWLWFHFPPGGRPGTIAQPPPVFEPVNRVLEGHPPCPQVDGEAAGEFVWSQRDTDLNQHVNSIAFLARAENAVFDRGGAVAHNGRHEVWYLKPGFRGTRTSATVEATDEAWCVKLAARDVTQAVIRLPR